MRWSWFSSRRSATFCGLIAQDWAIWSSDSPQDLALDKRVVYIHGVPADLELPESVGGKINDHYDQHVTLPIAAGKINRVD
ncbi:hypothetical protein ACXO22_01470 [Lactobacillus delbrueckii subsp. bulgaricus]